MINEAMPPGMNALLGLTLNLFTFCVGTIFSLSQIPDTAMAIISIPGSLEVAFYGALGGIASITAKYTVEICIKVLSHYWEKHKNQNQ